MLPQTGGVTTCAWGSSPRERDRVDGAGPRERRAAGVLLPLLGAGPTVLWILLLPNSICGQGIWMPCMYRAFQFVVAYSFLWRLGAWARVALHRSR